MRLFSPLQVGLILASGLPLLAAAQVGIVSQGGLTEAKNDLPVDVLVLSYSPSSKIFATLRVPAKGRVAAPAADATVVSMEPIAIEVGRREMFRACTVSPAASVNTRQIIDELKAVDFLTSVSAKEKIEAASALARIEIEQKLDEQRTFRSDPLRNELLRQQERYAPEAEKLLRQRQEFAQDMVYDVTALALAWSGVQEKRLRVLHDEYHSFEPLIEQARMAAQIRERELTAYDESTAGWQEYSAAGVRALDERAEKREAPIAKVRVQKSCTGPSQGWDWMEMEGPDLADVSALVAEVSFDRGTKQLTVMRRLSKTTRWAGRMDWPSGSTVASVRVRWPGSTRWYDTSGKIIAGRKSIATSVDEARRAVGKIEKKMKDGNFRAVGGDAIKTAPAF